LTDGEIQASTRALERKAPRADIDKAIAHLEATRVAAYEQKYKKRMDLAVCEKNRHPGEVVLKSLSRTNPF